MDKHTQRKVFQIAFRAAILTARLRELAPQHPDDTDSELVIPWSEIEELLDEYDNGVEAAWRGSDNAACE